MTDAEALKELLTKIDTERREMESHLKACKPGSYEAELAKVPHGFTFLHDGESIKGWVRLDGSFTIGPLFTRGTMYRGTRFLEYVAKELGLEKVARA